MLCVSNLSKTFKPYKHVRALANKGKRVENENLVQYMGISNSQKTLNP
jgi:hypothetical protein